MFEEWIDEHPEKHSEMAVIDRQWFEHLLVRRFILAVVLATLAIVLVFGVVLSTRYVTLDQLSKGVDTLLKALAIVVGALWSLNRYFVMRTDHPQLRVDAITDFVHSTSLDTDASFGLLSYRLDIVNTSKVLLRPTGYRVNIDSVIARDNRVLYERLYDWPATGLHQADPIEPGSWAGISDAIACPGDVRAIKLFLEVHLERKGLWTWHRILTLPQGQDLK